LKKKILLKIIISVYLYHISIHLGRSNKDPTHNHRALYGIILNYCIAN